MRHPSPAALTARHGHVRAAQTRERLDALVLTHLPIHEEPGTGPACVSGRGGVRIGDDALVTDSGWVVLTQAPRELHMVKR